MLPYKSPQAMDDLRIPSVYVLASSLREAEHPIVRDVLQITPCRCAIISDYRDSRFASEFCSEGVIHVATEQEALILATKFVNENIRPILVIGNASVLDAIYDDGIRETLVAKWIA